MSNHRWRNDWCSRCGLLRKRKTRKLRMAITSTPPYDHYLHETKMAYSVNGANWTFDRPTCTQP